jgi:hypothetical protein
LKTAAAYTIVVGMFAINTLLLNTLRIKLYSRTANQSMFKYSKPENIMENPIKLSIEDKVELITKELESAKWNIKYHGEELAKAQMREKMYMEQLEELTNEGTEGMASSEQGGEVEKKVINLNRKDKSDNPNIVYLESMSLAIDSETGKVYPLLDDGGYEDYVGTTDHILNMNLDEFKEYFSEIKGQLSEEDFTTYHDLHAKFMNREGSPSTTSSDSEILAFIKEQAKTMFKK